VRRARELLWAIAPADLSLDPERYLGDLRELPEPAEPGQWCEVTVEDAEGHLRWRLIAVEAGRETSLFEARRALAGTKVRAVGTDDPLEHRERVTGPAGRSPVDRG
jgi:hypothetical protein